MTNYSEQYSKLIENVGKHWDGEEYNKLKEKIKIKKEINRLMKKEPQLNKIDSELISKFSSEQEEIIKYNQSEMLIKGVAGSGKTLSLLYNAIEKAKKKTGVYFFTYNKVLKKYVEDILSKEDMEHVCVENFHRWALNVIKSFAPEVVVFGNSYPQKAERKKLLEHAIKNASTHSNGRFIIDKNYRDFLIEEINYMNNQYICNLEEYLSLKRVGRGSEIRLSQEDRKEIFYIFNYYQLMKFKNKYIEFHEFASILLNNIEKINIDTNHIFIDEAQDLNKADLLLLRNLAKETFYVAADKGQKIYPTNYSWKEIGINIRGGRTKSLTKSYRTTKEILRLAQCLQTHDDILKDEDYTEADILDMRTGPKPEIISFKTENDYKQKFLNVINKKVVDSQVVGILVDEWKDTTKLKKYLKLEGIPYEEIKSNEGSSLLPGVKFTTMHSSKGLEFDDIIIPNFIFEKKIDVNDVDKLNLRRRLYYVSFTRARNFLTILMPEYSPSMFYSELDNKLYNLR